MQKLSENGWCLPFELKVEIFRRLPLKTLGRFKLVSKDWYCLLSSNKFAKSLLQFSYFAKPYTLIFQSRSSVSSLKFNDLIVNDNDVTKFDLKTTSLEHPLPKSRTGIHYYCVGSYNGVVCIHITTLKYGEQIFVWNPITRELKPIPLPPDCDACNTHIASCFKKRFWFGNVDLLDDVIIFCLKQTRSYVFSMKKNKWRESNNSVRFDIGSEIAIEGCRNLGSRFVHIDGVLYCNLSLDYILKFDLVNGAFHRMRFLDMAHRDTLHDNMFYDIVDASLGVTQEKKLCSGRVFKCEESDKWILEIWTLQQYHTELGPGSWERLHRIELGKEPLGPCSYPWLIRFSHDGKVFVGGNKVLVVDPKQVLALQVQEVETRHVPIYTVDYVETLLSPLSLKESYLVEEQYM